MESDEINKEVEFKLKKLSEEELITIARVLGISVGGLRDISFQSDIENSISLLQLILLARALDIPLEAVVVSRKISREEHVSSLQLGLLKYLEENKTNITKFEEHVGWGTCNLMNDQYAIFQYCWDQLSDICSELRIEPFAVLKGLSNSLEVKR